MEDKPLPANPPVDCFFVYPTVSGQPSTNANKDKDDELIAIARYQAARFSERCRIYAPVYRQLTLASIFTGTQQQREEGGRLAYSDVREAWRSYLANDNRGRGVVLVSHSQGTRMLRQLLREEIDPDPAVRRRLVSGILLGGNVLVRKGQRAGGDFKNTPACSRTGETACVIAFSTFFDPPPPNARFGRSPASDTSGAGFRPGPTTRCSATTRLRWPGMPARRSPPTRAANRFPGPSARHSSRPTEDRRRRRPRRGCAHRSATPVSACARTALTPSGWHRSPRLAGSTPLRTPPGARTSWT